MAKDEHECLEKDRFKNIRYRLNILTGLFALTLTLVGWDFTDRRNREANRTQSLQIQAAVQQDIIWLKESIQRMERKLDRSQEKPK